VITLDSSGIIALLRDRDRNHSSALQVVEAESGPLVVPTGILSEVAYMLERWASGRELDVLLFSIETGSTLLDCGDQDIPRIRHLVARYHDLPLGFADASVIACAERRGGRVLTYDQRHFPVVAREGTITVVSGP
jgi:predicted nucleic acid-binding protein